VLGCHVNSCIRVAVKHKLQLGSMVGRVCMWSFRARCNLPQSMPSNPHQLAAASCHGQRMPLVMQSAVCRQPYVHTYIPVVNAVSGSGSAFLPVSREDSACFLLLLYCCILVMMAGRLESMAVDAQQRVLLEEALQQQAALHASSTQVNVWGCSSTAPCAGPVLYSPPAGWAEAAP